MKVGISKEEFYPVYVINGNDPDAVINVDDRIVARWKKTFDDFLRAQDEIHNVIHKQDKEDEP